jgi:nucleoside-diphosphate-sugar epimerase
LPFGDSLAILGQFENFVKEIMPLCLVTGASGFLGSHLAQELVKRGFQVRCLVRKTSQLEWLVDSGVEFVFGDIQDKESLKKILLDYEYIFHTAGLIKTRHPDLFDKVNHQGTRNLLEAAWENHLPLKRFVYISSQAASGPSLNGRPRKESDLCNPVSVYGVSKLAGEKTVLEYADRFPITIIRPPGIYGPRDRQLLSIFKLSRYGIMPILGEGDNQFNLIHVKDLVDGIILAALSPKAIGQTYYLTDGLIYSWYKAGQILAEVQQKKFRTLTLPKWIIATVAALSDLVSHLIRRDFYLTSRKVRELKYKHWISDTTKAKSELGFRPAYDFRTGARQTIGWYKEKGWI